MPKNVGQKIGVFGEFLEFWSVFGVVWSVFGEVWSRRKFLYMYVQNSPGEHLKMNDFVFRGGGKLPQIQTSAIIYKIMHFIYTVLVHSILHNENNT